MRSGQEGLNILPEAPSMLPLDNAVVLLVFIHCLLLHHLFVCVCGGGAVFGPYFVL